MINLQAYLQNHPSQKLSPSKMDSNCWAVSASADMLPSMSLDVLTSSLDWLPDGHWKLEIETGLVVTQPLNSLPNLKEYLDRSFFISTEQSLCTSASAMSGVRNPSCWVPLLCTAEIHSSAQELNILRNAISSVRLTWHRTNKASKWWTGAYSCKPNQSLLHS